MFRLWQSVVYLFDYSVFNRRGFCGRWDTFHESLYYWSQLGIFVEYLAIPAVALLIAWTVHKAAMEQRLSQAVVKFSALRLSLAMGAFVVSCGFGHLFDGIGAFHYPAYRFFAWWHFFTFLAGLWSLSYSVRIAVGQILLLRS